MMSPVKSQSQLRALRTLFTVLLSCAALSFAETPPWERLLEPAEPDTEAIKKVAETPKSRPAAEESAPPPVLDRKEQERIEKEKRENEKREAERKEREKKEQEKEKREQAKKEQERLKKEQKEQKKKEKEKKAQEEKAKKEQEKKAQGDKKAQEEKAIKEQEDKKAQEEKAIKEQEDKKAQEEKVKKEQGDKKAQEEKTMKEQEEKKAQEEKAKREQEEKKAQEEKAKKEQEEKKAQEEKAKKEQAEKKAQEEKARKEQEERRAQEKKEQERKAQSESAKPVEPSKAAKPPFEMNDDGNDDDMPPKSAETPAKPVEPAKADAAPKPLEPARAEAAPAAFEPAVASVEPAPVPKDKRDAAGTGTAGAAFEESGSRLGIRAALGVGGLGGHEPVYFDPVVREVNGRRSPTDVFLRYDNDILDSIFRHTEYGREIELWPSLSGGVSVVLLSKINGQFGISCEVQYSFYFANGELADKDVNKYGDNPLYWPLSEVSVEMHSLEVPVLLRVNTGASLVFPLYIEVGPQFGFNVYARRTEYNENVMRMLKPNLNVFEVGPVLGAGLDIGGISVGARLYYGLMEYVTSTGGRPWSFTLGVTAFF